MISPAMAPELSLGRKTLGAYKKRLAEKSVARPDRPCTFYKAAKEAVGACGDAAGLSFA